MNQERLKQLFKFLEEDPNDPFTLYAIAIEYQRNEPDKALEYFDNLLQYHEHYLGTYYHAAKLSHALGKTEKAEAIFKKGLALAHEQGDRHALRELQQAYNEFLFEEE